MPGRFPAQQRVRKRPEFLRIQAQGRRVSTPHFVLALHASSSSQAGAPRLGITAPKRVGNAVARNRAKRLVREAFRATRDLFQPGVDLVVIVRKPLKDATCAHVIAEFRRVQGLIGKRTEEAFRDARNRERPLAEGT